jgi:SAM-dependent methyltransferase
MMSALLRKFLGRVDFYSGVLTQDYRRRAFKDYNTFTLFRNMLRPYMGDIKGKFIIDIGCGRRYPYTLLFHSLGNHVVGIDLSYIAHDDIWVRRYLTELTRNGAESFSRTLLFDILKQRRTYYNTLQSLCDFPLNYQGLVFERMNVENLLFPDETFDLAVSALCFEHIANVSKAISEVHRVLKMEGIACIQVHLFTSRTGGHHLGKQFDKVPPWDHLRQNRFPVPIYMNKLRKAEWLKLFSQKFEILEVLNEIDKDGEKLLTPKILDELSEYSIDELLTSTITIVARKRS